MIYSERRVMPRLSHGDGMPPLAIVFLYIAQHADSALELVLIPPGLFSCAFAGYNQKSEGVELTSFQDN